ncbi:hypothetical protein CRUP_029308 [Coryphaenoides rupestris]|nr:hypothetical protein CRUP_029308 [Coryphaenoides rupestris]
MFPCHHPHCHTPPSWSSSAAQTPPPGPDVAPPPDPAPAPPLLAQQQQTPPLPDLLCRCPAPGPAPPDPIVGSLIVITEYEPSQPGPSHTGGGGDEETEDMDSSEAPEAVTSCDLLLSHTPGGGGGGGGRPEALLLLAEPPRGRLNLSDRKLSLQERWHPASSPCASPGCLADGRYIYPSLPYSPVTSPHSSPRLPRRPTVESHRVSITDLQDCVQLNQYKLKDEIGKETRAAGTREGAESPEAIQSTPHVHNL